MALPRPCLIPGVFWASLRVSASAPGAHATSMLGRFRPELPDLCQSLHDEPLMLIACGLSCLLQQLRDFVLVQRGQLHGEAA